MIEVSQCVICDGAIRGLKRALVAPFLATRIWNRDPFCVDLVQCEACGFQFYNPRLDDDDLHRLYANYRAEEYWQMRHASEPWYTRQFNIDLASPASYANRRAMLAPILEQHVGQRKISRILDYGGDRGDLVADLYKGAEAFVYDISQIPPAPGVTSTSDPASCKADLILNSNVLEHVGFPRHVVSEMFQAAPEGGLVFIEVPCEFPLGFDRLARRIAQIGVMSLLRPSLARFVVRPASIYMMHEHINYFTEQTLTTLIRNCGGGVLAAGAYPSSGRAGKADMAWCMGIKTTVSHPA
jgi:SAM-dependent methyltransferase